MEKLPRLKIKRGADPVGRLGALVHWNPLCCPAKHGISPNSTSINITALTGPNARGEHLFIPGLSGPVGGPYNEADYPYPYTADPDTATPQLRKHVQMVVWLPGRTSATDNNVIKSYLTSFGAVTVAFYYDATFAHSTYKSYYYTSAHVSNHEVCIIGWDDAFDKSKL